MFFLKKRSRKQKKGQGLVEYALILVLVSVVVLAALLLLGPKTGDIFSKVNGILAPEIRSYGASVSTCQAQGGQSWTANTGSGSSFTCYSGATPSSSIIFIGKLQ